MIPQLRDGQKKNHSILRKAPNDIHWLPFRFGIPKKNF